MIRSAALRGFGRIPSSARTSNLGGDAFSSVPKQCRSLFQLPKVPYIDQSDNGVRPAATKKSLAKHYDHFSQTVSKLNKVIAGTPFERISLRRIIRDTSVDPKEAYLHSLASETWNHNFFWNCLVPKEINPSGEVSETVAQGLEFHFGSVERFKLKFADHACSQFTNGWVWLVDKEGHLEILNTAGTTCPLSYRGVVPLLALDMWEHAYWDDYGDNKAEYVNNFWEVVDWSFVQGNLERSTFDEKKYVREPELRLWDYPFAFASDGHVQKAENERKHLTEKLDELMDEYEEALAENEEEAKRKRDEAMSTPMFKL